MDEELRRLLRRAQANNDVASEAAYLNKLLQINHVSDRQLEIASYLGYPASEAIRPYDVPYRVAELMDNIPEVSGNLGDLSDFDPDNPPEGVTVTYTQSPEVQPPRSSWFCDPLDKKQDAGDVADLWVDNLTFEYEPELAVVTALLALKFIIANADLQQIPRNYFRRTYGKACRSLLTGIQTNWIPIHIEDTEVVYLSGISENIISALNQRFRRSWPSEEAQSAYRHFVSEALLYAIDLCQAKVLTEQLCEFLTHELPPYVLGYVELEELLDPPPYSPI